VVWPTPPARPRAWSRAPRPPPCRSARRRHRRAAARPPRCLARHRHPRCTHPSRAASTSTPRYRQKGCRARGRTRPSSSLMVSRGACRVEPPRQGQPRAAREGLAAHRAVVEITHPAVDVRRGRCAASSRPPPGSFITRSPGSSAKSCERSTDQNSGTIRCAST
jgi:hypothetical protein